MLNKKKIAVVTGGAGFIGSHMVDLLLAKKYRVHVIDNLSGGHKKNLAHHYNNPLLKFKKIDICKLKKNNKLFKNATYVFHFAGVGDVVPSIKKPDNYMMINVQGTVRVLEAARHAKVKKFIYAASASCYGMNSKRTKESSKINLQNPYALSKYLGEKVVFNWSKVYGLPANSIRIFNAYGTRNKTTGSYSAVIGVFFKQKLKKVPLTIVGDGKQTRDFIYVTDIAEAFLAAAKTSIVGTIYNVGAGNSQSVNFLANLIGGKKVFVQNRLGETKHSCANIGKIKRQLKWKPKVLFKDGLAKIWNEITK